MQNASGIEVNAGRRNLALLVRLRWVAIAGQTLAILTTHFALGIAMPLVAMMAVLMLLVAVNLVARARSRRPAPVTHSVLTIEIAIDVLALTLLLFLSGGATNPFTSLFILQDIVAIVLLPPVEAGVILLISIVAGLVLLGFGEPLTLPARHEAGPGFDDLTLVGTYLSFIICALLSAWFIMGIRANLNRRNEELARVQHQIDEESSVLRIGLLASTAAHDLGTPLTNLAVILDDWADLGLPPPDEMRRQAALMQEAVQSCRATISRLLQAAGAARMEEATAQDVADFATQVAERWQADNRRLTVSVSDERKRPCRIIADVLLRKALENLLDNAAEAGALTARITIRSAGLRVEVAVCDDGPGFPTGLLASGPTLFQSGHVGEEAPPSRGLGLVLVQSVLRRLGGDLKLSNGAEGGARAALLLPYIA